MGEAGDRGDVGGSGVDSGGAASHEFLNILVIDDDPAMRELISSILTSRDHQVIPVESAEEGLALLPQWTFHIAFVDHNLPGMEGAVFGEYLRKNNPDMSIALVTGDDDRTLERRSKDLAITFVPKPFDTAQILDLVDDYRARARERRQTRLAEGAADYSPSLAEHLDELTLAFAIPKVPGRMEERIVATIKRALHELRSVSRYTEHNRVLAYSGLVTARVLGMNLPTLGERTLYEEYDALMKMHGRRTEFGAE